MPGFRWWEKDRQEAFVSNSPKNAREIEKRHSNGKGLLYADGASRANLVSGECTPLDDHDEHRAREARGTRR